MDRGRAGFHRVRAGEGDVLHAQRIEHPLSHDLTQPLAANALDHLPDPVDVGAVLPLIARIEEQRSLDGGAGAGDDRRLAVLLRHALVHLVEEVIAEAARVQHQLPGGHVGLRRAQSGLAVGVEPFDNLKVPDGRGVGFRGGIKVQKPLFDALKRRCPGDGLGGGEDRKDRVLGHRVVAQPPLARCA